MIPTNNDLSIFEDGEPTPDPRFYLRDEAHMIAVMQKAFDLSHAQGLGFLHYSADHTLPEEEARNWINSREGRIVDMDYVSGRAVKLTFFVDRDSEPHRYYIEDRGYWFDHSPVAWEELKVVLIGH